jgi:hypothetical protein
MAPQDSLRQRAPRLEGMRALRDAVRLLDDEELLDQRGRDRVLSCTLGTLKRECDRALAERESQQMSLDAGRVA